MPAGIVVVVGGPSGTGKSTIGAAVAAALRLPFIDGDDYHPEANKAKMRGGTPLTDSDRLPWLTRLHDEVIEPALDKEGAGVVLGCSSLRHMYRDVLRGKCSPSRVVFVMLTGDPAVIGERMARRSAHFMPPVLLASQFATLEPLDKTKEEGCVVDVTADSPEEVTAQALEWLAAWKANQSE